MATASRSKRVKAVEGLPLIAQPQPFERRLLQGLGAILVVCVAIAVALFLRLLLFALTPDPEIGTGAGNVNPSDEGVVLPLIAFVLSTPLIAYLLWDSTNSSWRRTALYCVTVLFVGAFSWANYWSGDTLVPRSYQAGLNLVLAFSGTVAIALVWNMDFRTVEGVILKYVAIISLAAAAVLLPIVFDIIYVAAKLNRGHDSNLQFFLSKDAREWIGLACSLGGLALGVLKYRDERAKRLGAARSK